MLRWADNDELFKKELEAGFEWQLKVAKYLKQCGFNPKVPKLTFRDKIADAHLYKDLEDIECCGKLIEVKSRKLYFTCPNDFPYDTIMIDTTDGWDGKENKPDAYVCISRFTDKMIVLPSRKTCKHWVKTRRFDNTRKIYVDSYECHREHWRSMDSFVLALNKIK